MTHDLVYLTCEQIDTLHDDLIEATGGLRGMLRDCSEYIAEVAPYHGENLCEVAAFYLSRISKGHNYNDGNKRTGYFATRLFLMLNGADFNGSNIEEAVEEMSDVAAAPTMDDALGLAKRLCEKHIVTDQVRIPDYKVFKRLVIKSINMANRLSKS